MTTLRVFVSSVRQGLEEERDALGPLITAIGHVPSRFEDFTAQPVASREACLAGVEQADVYLLLLGPHYGEPLSDSGMSPTEEEWTVAKRRGIPILVFRKAPAAGDPKQAAFMTQVENYVTGRFRDTFVNAVDLLPKVAEKLRELASATGPLVWEALDHSVSPEWVITDERSRYSTTGVTLELHVVPIDAPGRVSAVKMESYPESLAHLGRGHRLFGSGDALTFHTSENRASAERGASRDHAAAGVAVHRDHAVSIWQELPSDGLGVIVDPSDLGARLAQGLRMSHELLPPGGRAALAVGLGPTQMASEGDIRELGRRSSASMGYHRNAIRVEVEDAVPVDAMARAADEISRELTARLMLRFRSRAP